MQALWIYRSLSHALVVLITLLISEFVELSHKALAKLKFRVLNNILSVACRVASCKPPKPAFVDTCDEDPDNLEMI